MKKILIILISLLLVTGCSNIYNMDYEDVIQILATKSNKSNTFRTGYSYYLPRNMQVVDSTLYNEVLEDSMYKYYLYVDVVSYYKNVEKDYEINNQAIYSTKISYDGKYGYAEVNLVKNDKYLVEIMYNYAKIEVIVDEDKCNEAMMSAINILKSVEYNDSIIANLLGDDILNFYETEFNIFNTKGKEENYIKADDSYQEVEEKIPDPDLIN